MSKQITHGDAECNTCSMWCWNACGVAMWREWTLTLISVAYVFSIKEIITPATVPTFVTHTAAKCGSDTVLRTNNVQNW